jgi:hypothetical protein
MPAPETCFFCPQKEEWCVGKPSAGSLRCKNSRVYSHDGFQWRKQCSLCVRIARPNSDFCRVHGPRVVEPVIRGSSQLACTFFDKLETELCVKIVHRHYTDTLSSGSEFRVPGTPYRVDGLVVGTNIVLEVLGDFWHGNPDFFAEDRVNPVVKLTYGQLRRETFDRFERITTAGYIVFYVWESALKRNPIQKVCNLLTRYIPFSQKITTSLHTTNDKLTVPRVRTS